MVSVYILLEVFSRGTIVIESIYSFYASRRDGSVGEEEVTY